MRWHKGHRKRPQTEDEVLSEALAELQVEDEKKRRRKARRGRGRWHLPTWLEPRVFVWLGVIALAILADGVRRENLEFRALLVDFKGPVTVQEPLAAAPVPAEANHSLQDGSIVRTGAGAYAIVEFPDGSAATLDQGTELLVRLLEYSRGGRWRARSLYLACGRMWAQVGAYFGPDSEMRVYTPSAVAAVRGTQYAVAHDPQTRVTRITCNDGYVAAEGFTGSGIWVGQGAETSVRLGSPPAVPGWMDVATRQTFGQPALTARPEPPSWVTTTELGITRLLDAPLTILGIGKCSWAVGCSDVARRGACVEALRRIQTFMEGFTEAYPAFLNPATLEGIPALAPEDALRILRSFDGAALARYEPLPGRTYRITVRARDRSKTAYVLTPSEITRWD